MERIILDTDIGTDVDDVMAVALAALSPELKVEGIAGKSLPIRQQRERVLQREPIEIILHRVPHLLRELLRFQPEPIQLELSVPFGLRLVRRPG